MNSLKDSTSKSTNPDFPIPYYAQEPRDDAALAFSIFEVIDRLLEDGCRNGIQKNAVVNLIAVFGEARAKLEPIARYLEDDDRTDSLARYQAARRALILEYWRAAA